MSFLDNLDAKKQFVAKFYGDKNGKLDIGDKASLDKIVDQLQSASYRVESVKMGKREKKGTSAIYDLYLTAGGFQGTELFYPEDHAHRPAVMYEGVDVKGNGTVGLITICVRIPPVYRMRQRAQRLTLSHRIMERIICRKGLPRQRQTGPKYRMPMRAIRPSDITRLPSEIRTPYPETSSVYQLIWKRFVASQMSSAVYETVNVKIAAGDYRFTVADSSAFLTALC